MVQTEGLIGSKLPGYKDTRWNLEREKERKEGRAKNLAMVLLLPLLAGWLAC